MRVAILLGLLVIALLLMVVGSFLLGLKVSEHRPSREERRQEELEREITGEVPPRKLATGEGAVVRRSRMIRSNRWKESD